MWWLLAALNYVLRYSINLALPLRGNLFDNVVVVKARMHESNSTLSLPGEVSQLMKPGVNTQNPCPAIVSVIAILCQLTETLSESGKNSPTGQRG
jgi:hypothetical protein